MKLKKPDFIFQSDYFKLIDLFDYIDGKIDTLIKYGEINKNTNKWITDSELLYFNQISSGLKSEEERKDFDSIINQLLVVTEILDYYVEISK